MHPAGSHCRRITGKPRAAILGFKAGFKPPWCRSGPSWYPCPQRLLYRRWSRFPAYLWHPLTSGKGSQDHKKLEPCVPQERELTYVLDTKRHLEDLEKLWYVFSLPCFIDDERDCLTCFIDDERDCLTCLDNSDRLESVMYYYPDFRIEGINPTEKLSWWLVCDAD